MQGKRHGGRELLKSHPEVVQTMRKFAQEGSQQASSTRMPQFMCNHCERCKVASSLFCGSFAFRLVFFKDPFLLVLLLNLNLILVSSLITLPSAALLHDPRAHTIIRR